MSNKGLVGFRSIEITSEKEVSRNSLLPKNPSYRPFPIIVIPPGKCEINDSLSRIKSSQPTMRKDRIRILPSGSLTVQGTQAYDPQQQY